ncbi:unnamed protein product [Oikopleura dioica]|uniref:Uncharacterized protein n=1 Tax=Oikopleura dioica TaxID=34765 RepID=E4Y5V8_OIKDI|nr:unnamed protein product [Oikopleura dioica]
MTEDQSTVIPLSTPLSGETTDLNVHSTISSTTTSMVYPSGKSQNSTTADLDLDFIKFAVTETSELEDGNISTVVSSTEEYQQTTKPEVTSAVKLTTQIFSRTTESDDQVFNTSTVADILSEITTANLSTDDLYVSTASFLTEIILTETSTSATISFDSLNTTQLETTGVPFNITSSQAVRTTTDSFISTTNGLSVPSSTQTVPDQKTISATLPNLVPTALSTINSTKVDSISTTAKSLETLNNESILAFSTNYPSDFTAESTKNSLTEISTFEQSTLKAQEVTEPNTISTTTSEVNNVSTEALNFITDVGMETTSSGQTSANYPKE